MRKLSLVVVCLLIQTSAHAMSMLAESVRMVNIPGVDRRAVLVEAKDPAALQDLKLPVATTYRVEPVFSGQLLQTLKSQSNAAFEKYYYLIFDAQLSAGEATAVLRYLNSQNQIARAYFEPTIADPIAYPIYVPKVGKNSVLKSFEAAPDFTSRQIYLEPAPKGLDAKYAWTQLGGDGAGIRLADVETGWYQEHHEFNKAFYENGQNARRDHGTAVWGIIAAKPDGVGVTGIANGVDFATCGTGAQNGGDYFTLLARAIGEATAQLRPGDVLLVEQHQAGPDAGNYAPVEFSTPIYELLKATTDRGVHCVEAAGNGSSNLDSPAYQGAFDRKVRDSGCIIVGAGGSPEGSTPLAQLGFSDYGSRVDAFAYGEMTTTTGYGDLFGAGDIAGNYTSEFNGTSSATPMVAAVVASLAGMAKAKGVTLTPAAVREAMHNTGTPSAEKTSNIGRMPDLKALAAVLFAPKATAAKISK